MLPARLPHTAGTKKEKWVKDHQGQMIITAGQIIWTSECEKALADPDEAKVELKALKRKWVSTKGKNKKKLVFIMWILYLTPITLST